ncbi:MAG: thioesterase family protein [Acidimicrobiales bacterium]
MVVETGVHGVAEMTVTEVDTAAVVGSGDVDVLATPRLIALCEQAACRAVAHRLKPGETTVGLRVEFTHLAPTRVGSVVRAEATLERIDGRRMLFTVSASDACGLVGAGKMQRVTVDRGAFMDKAR